MWGSVQNEKLGILVQKVEKECHCCSAAKSYLTLQPHELQHARLPCPPLSPGACSNSCPLGRWCHSTIKKQKKSAIQFSSVQSLSRVQLFATPWIAAHQASLSIPNSQNPPKPMFIKSVRPSNHLILCHPLLLLPSNEYPGLISWRMDWLDLLAAQGAQESSPTPHSKASIILCSAFFMVQLSHPYMTIGKTIALTGRTSVDKAMSLLFNMLSRS